MTPHTAGVLVSLLQIIIALGLINVWILRFHKRTQYRGGDAGNMREEFAAYGLPVWSVYVVGTLKVAIALILLATLVAPALMYTATVLALGLLAFLMLGALSMHLKVHDRFTKFIPALSILAMTLLTLYLMTLA